MDMDWKKICTVPDCKTHVEPRTWTYDKYPDAPALKAHSSVTLLDQDGPGVVTLLHVSDYLNGDDSLLILRVWYDHGAKPAVDMPLMDFLGDIESSTGHYQTIYFSHVKESHNFRLPMPFREHIRIEVENPTGDDLVGYTELQWDELEELPPGCGVLHADFRCGTFFFPQEELVLCEVESAGSVVAHWLQLGGDPSSSPRDGGHCEANHEIYLDGDQIPTGESLGTEDFYGHSWGFQGLESDGYAAIIRYDRYPAGGKRVGLLRAHDLDRITFRKSCKIVFTYRHDIGEKKAPTLRQFIGGDGFTMDYRSCYYYYT
jgi:hypothetical protein